MEPKMKKLHKRVLCADGFSMSVQANAGTYCCPRTNNADSYISVEVGFPSHVEPLLMPFCEDPKDPTETVYAYVPSTTIYLVIAKHGGMTQSNCQFVFRSQRSGIVKIGDVIQDKCFPEDKGIILKIKGDRFLVVEFTMAKADWYHRKYINTCRVISCE